MFGTNNKFVGIILFFQVIIEVLMTHCGL